MRLVETDSDRTRTCDAQSLVVGQGPGRLGGDLGVKGRRPLKELLEGTMQACRDEWVEVPWQPPAATRKTHRNGFYRRPPANTHPRPMALSNSSSRACIRR